MQPGDVGQAHLTTAAAGVIATVVSDTVNVPFDTVKQRLQVVALWPQHVSLCISASGAIAPAQLLLQLNAGGVCCCGNIRLLPYRLHTAHTRV